MSSTVWRRGSGESGDTRSELRDALGEAALGLAALAGLFLLALGLCGLCGHLDRPDRLNRPDPHAAAGPEAEK